MICEDTKEPVRNAWLTISSFNPTRDRGNPFRRQTNNTAVGRTDAKGRFGMNLYPGETVHVEAFAPAGAPYLGVARRLNWPKGAARQQLEVALPRGVLVRGKVTEELSGQPVERAQVYYVPQQENNPGRRGDLLIGSYHKVPSKADGSFQISVPAGRGHLLVEAPTPDYVSRTLGSEELVAGRPGGRRLYHHGVAALDLTLKDKPKELKLTLKRGVTIKGRVVGPDGKPARQAAMLCGGELVRPSNSFYAGVPAESNVATLLLRDGTFELPGCDPDRTYRVYFLDAAQGGMPMLWARPGRAAAELEGVLAPDGSRLGAVVELSAKQAGGKSVTVKLEACGKALVRLVEARGKPPAARRDVTLELLVRPGPSLKKAVARKVLSAEGAVVASTILNPFGKPLAAGPNGELTLSSLIPGATYRLKVYTPDLNQREILAEKDFTAEAGKVLKLGDLVVPEAK
jgi:hypothetical protein